MSTYPRKPRAAFLDWCRVHESVFAAHAAEIGVTPGEAKAFQEAAQLCQARLLKQAAAQEAAKVATQEVRAAFDELNRRASNMVRRIRAFAEAGQDPDTVYATAEIPPIASPTPMGPPAQPVDLAVTLQPTDGSVELRWHASNPPGSTGTVYLVKRRCSGNSPFEVLGVTGHKRFVDATLPAGTGEVQYTVQGLRGQRLGQVSAIFALHLGVKESSPARAGTSSAPQTSTWNAAIPAPAPTARRPQGRTLARAAPP